MKMVFACSLGDYCHDRFYQGSINKSHRISLNIDTYQVKRLVEDRALAHHSINILSKGGSHFELEE